MPQGKQNGPDETIRDESGVTWTVPTYTGLPSGVCNHCGGDGSVICDGYGGEYASTCIKCHGSGKMPKTIFEHLLED